MRCALVLFSNAAFEGIFRLQVLGSAGIDRCAISRLPAASWGALVTTWLNRLLLNLNLRSLAIILDHKIHTSRIPIYTR